MSEALKGEIEELAETDWEPYGSDGGEIRECAEVPFVPSERRETKQGDPMRYVAIRVRSRQGELFGDGSRVKHFAVVTNLWEWKPARLIQWHREKAGTIEPLHDVLKNELAAGVLPCGRFGADAAWLRLAVIAHNVMTALKRLALPAELLRARPKRLRFLIFHTPSRLVAHARKIRLKLSTTTERIGQWIEALRLLPLPT